ncbi:MAG: T9SS type A sorting domain-containing protein [Chitinophagales bacterium]|nr:T9SS type A sorting domain-containing protein [Chitinophagales bacterium]
MRSLVIALILGFFSIGKGQWYEISNLTEVYSLGGTFRDMVFLNDSVGIVPYESIILRSVDKGYTWDTVYQEATGACKFSKVEFYNEQVGLARTFFGLMEGVRTEDGGLTWEAVPGSHDYESFDFLTEDVILWGETNLWKKSLSEPWEYTLDGPPVTSLYMFNIDVVDQDTAYIATGISLWKYMGDDSIVLSDNKSCGDVFFPSARIGYYTDVETIYRTIDYGHSWDTLPFTYIINAKNTEIPYINSMQFVSDSIGFLRTYEDNLGELNDVGVLWRTIDAGWTWDTIFSSIFIPEEEYGGVVSFYFISPETGWALTNKGHLFYTTTGGGDEYILLPPTVSVQHAGSLPLTLHPNPATDQLFLEGLAGYPDAVWNTYSISGQTIPLDLRNGQADISHLPPGIYLTTVHTRQGIWREKWVKL